MIITKTIIISHTFYTFYDDSYQIKFYIDFVHFIYNQYIVS